MPCLQYDFANWVIWDRPDDQPSCFINHFADKKEGVIEQTEAILKTVGGGQKDQNK